VITKSKKKQFGLSSALVMAMALLTTTATTIAMSTNNAYAEPIISIEEERSSCNPDPDVTFADFALYMRVDNIPLGTQGWAIVTMESSDGVETLVYRGWSIGQVEQGWIAGGIETVLDVGQEPYTLTFYEAVGPDPESTEPYNPETDIFPKPGGATASLTFTCEDLDAEVTPPDITAPVITVPDDIAEEATSPDGAQVSFEEVTAEDDVDGAVDVSCDYNSGDTFPIGETVVTCSAEDAAGNPAEESFSITVQDTTPPDVEITEAVDRRNREVADGGTTPTPYIQITFQATDAVGIDNTECSLDGQSFTSCTSPVVYDRLSRGTHEVIVRATDAAENTGEDEFTWTVGNPSAAAPGRQ
jgi:HYR domain